MPSFDVAIPNFNYGRFLADCIRSVLSQDVGFLRVLLIDNASTDESLAIAQEFAATDPRLEIRVHRRNLGHHASFNAGIDWARSEYFLILCADDMLSPGALRRAGEVLGSDPSLAFCYGRDVGIARNQPAPTFTCGPEPARWRRIAGAEFVERFCRLGVFQLPGPTLVTRTAAHKQAGYYRPELSNSDDYELWLRLALIGDVAELDNVQGVIRVHGENRSNGLRSRQLLHIKHTEAAAEQFFAREGAGLAEAPRLLRVARRGLAARAYWAALSTWSRGEPGTWELMRYALAADPFCAIAPPLTYLGYRPDTLRRIAASLHSLRGRMTRHPEPRRADGHE